MMYTLTSVLFAVLSLVLSTLAVPVSVLDDINGLEKRTADYLGKATYFYPDLGSCGEHNNNRQLVVAISTKINDYDSYCGEYVQMIYGNKSVKAKVVDACPSCEKNDLDLSPAAFKDLASLSLGKIEIKWKFIA